MRNVENEQCISRKMRLVRHLMTVHDMPPVEAGELTGLVMRKTWAEKNISGRMIPVITEPLINPRY